MIYTKVRSVKSPSKGTDGSAGYDFFIPYDLPDLLTTISLAPGESINIPSGIKVVIPPTYAGIFFNKSSIGIKGLLVGACVVDSDYRGEVHLNVHNVSNKPVELSPGQKLVQMLVLPYHSAPMVELDNEYYDQTYSNTTRGSGGFGSTGA